VSKATELEVVCPYCGRPAELVDIQVIYGKSYGLIWLCRPCEAWVGTHKNSKKHAPLGRLANEELRNWKKRAHERFDLLWQRKVRKEGCTVTAARRAAYKWLAEQLGISMRACHIGRFDVEQCKRTVAICAMKGGKNESVA